MICQILFVAVLPNLPKSVSCYLAWSDKFYSLPFYKTYQNMFLAILQDLPNFFRWRFTRSICLTENDSVIDSVFYSIKMILWVSFLVIRRFLFFCCLFLDLFFFFIIGKFRTDISYFRPFIMIVVLMQTFQCTHLVVCRWSRCCPIRFAVTSRTFITLIFLSLASIYRRMFFFFSVDC